MSSTQNGVGDNDAEIERGVERKVIETLKEFEEHLRADGKLPRTMESYLEDVSEFLDFLVQDDERFYENSEEHVTALISQLSLEN